MKEASSTAFGSSPAVVPPEGAWRAAAEFVRGRISAAPVAGVVLGSGLDVVAAGMDIDDEIPYADLPGFPEPTVAGHAGLLASGRIAGVPVVVFRGRIHLYEGHGMEASSLPTTVSWALGARALILTAAVGSLDPSFAPGSLVICSDHLNLMGESPLRDWRSPDGGPAFVDLSRVYDERLADAAFRRAERKRGSAGTGCAWGVYAAVPGPSFETPAEAEYLRRVGATVVGMSMVPEAVPARALGLRVLGLLSVANAVGVEVSHAEVLAASRGTGAAIAEVLEEVLPLLSET
ncbi:MAG: purine-nucleoside phosphorylase [Actinomycetota bacterium]|nr:purine-nucleoside phosphorylase [Actinomycetota bacterium]